MSLSEEINHNIQWKAFFAGDVVIQQTPAKAILSDAVHAIVKEHDIVSCNFEAPIISSQSKPIPKAGPHVFQHPDSVKWVTEAGFNVISLANNHMVDYGLEALNRTVEAFAGITTVGASRIFEEAYTLKIKEVKGIQVGFLSFAEWGFGAAADPDMDLGGFAWIYHSTVNTRIQQARKQVDVLIVQVHAGAEEVDLPLPEWRQRYRELIELGAHAVIGHHPHVPQGWEKHQDGLIFYSLGNFYFDMESAAPYWNIGYAVSLSFQGKKLQRFEVMPIQRTADGVKPDSNQGLAKHLSYLCDILQENVYRKKLNDQTMSLWKERYQPYYLYAMHGLSNDISLFESAKRVVKRLLKRNQMNTLLLQHNIRIETHRYVVERALSLLEKQ